MSTDDDDALSWAGDEEPGARGTGAERPARTARRRRQDASASAPVRESTRDAEADAVDGQTGSAALVILGLLGGVHLLYAVGWVVSIAPLQAVFGPSDVLGGVLFGLGLAFAAASPVVWFVAAFWFTRSRPVWQRIAGLLAGAIVLVPWPFVVGVR
jgi:hypothetical protein